MKKTAMRAAAVLLAVAMITVSVCAVDVYDIAPTDWFYSQAKTLVDNDIMDVDGIGNFNPDNGTTRGEFVMYVWRALGEPMPDVEDVEGKFTDLMPGAPYYSAVLWAAHENITAGVSDTSFAPDMVLDREQAFAFLYNALVWYGYDMSQWKGLGSDQLVKFKDVADVSMWAIESMGALTAEGIVNGTSDGKVLPKKAVTNSATASLLYQTLKLIYAIDADGNFVGVEG